MSLDTTSRATFNLKNTSILLVEHGAMGMDILVQILVGFGAKSFQKCDNIADAKTHISKVEFDLMIVDAVLGEEDGYDLVSWARREAPDMNKFCPLIVITPHTGSSRVSRARDCGAHFVVAKPLTPMVLLERILWVVREQRSFVEAPNFVGPDRRFKFEGPPTGTTGRRKDDLSAKIGDAQKPNMSQDQIDGLMQPRKVSL